MKKQATKDPSDMLVIRRAELFDLRPIRRIDRASFSTPWTEGLSITQITAPGRVHFVVEHAGNILGHGGLVFLDDTAHVATIAVGPSWRGCGFGDMLMNRFAEVSAANGCRGLTLEVRASNARAIALYERHDFAMVGRRKGYYRDNGEDAIIMTSQP